jgi:predicted acyl esterase
MRVRVLSVASALLAAMLLAAAPVAGAKVINATFSAHGSVEQVYVLGTPGGALLTLVDRHGVRLASKRADALGGALFRGVTPGSGYRVREATAGGTMQSGALTVLPDRSAPPSTTIYGQQIPAGGYGYLTTRDGTKLAIDVRLPSGPPPYPTLVEYAGYGYANPAGAESGISQIANLLGFAVVDVNMRGTGCSGGAFDYFEPLQGLDGYDVIETVARQPWVLHNRVGALGISYGGISQLFVAATDPPHLAAITPLSVIDNTATTLYPGGLLNTRFALQWAMQRAHDAQPASATTGQPWAFARIQQGDQTCGTNQALHGEATNLIAKVYANHYYVPSVANPLAPVTFAHKIHVPVFLACQWTDEQTGGHCPALASQFTGTTHKWFTFTNGTHIDSLDPATFNRWYDFLELYVAQQAPTLSGAVKTFLAPAIYSAAMGIPGLVLPPDPIQDEPTYSAALGAYQALPSVRIMFDNGAGGPVPGDPGAGFERSFARFPVPGTLGHVWYLGASGTLGARPPLSHNVEKFTWNKHARPATSFTGDTGSGPGGLWTATPQYDWAQNPAGTALSYITAPLGQDMVVVGGGAAYLWIKASVPSVDLQVTVSEVRPDGMETYVQDGWLRASERKLNSRQSTLLYPAPTFSRADAAPLPKGRFALVAIPLYYEGHVYRKGSRIRIIIAAPGGDQPVWGFSRTRPAGNATVSVRIGLRRPSMLVLPVLTGVTVPTGLPPCPGLRGEPCRHYQASAHAARP